MSERLIHWCALKRTHRMCGLPAAAISVLSAVISSLLTWKQMVANQSQRQSVRLAAWPAKEQHLLLMPQHSSAAPQKPSHSQGCAPGYRRTAACGSKCLMSPPRTCRRQAQQLSSVHHSECCSGDQHRAAAVAAAAASSREACPKLSRKGLMYQATSQGCQSRTKRALWCGRSQRWLARPRSPSGPHCCLRTPLRLVRRRSTARGFGVRANKCGAAPGRTLCP